MSKRSQFVDLLGLFDKWFNKIEYWSLKLVTGFFMIKRSISFTSEIHNYLLLSFKFTFTRVVVEYNLMV